MIRGDRLLKLLESEMSAKRGPKGYKAKLRGLLGLGKDRRGRPALASNPEVRPDEVSLQEVAYTFLGRNYRDRLKEAAHVGMVLRESGTVLPSHFAHISGFNDTVAGLLDAAVLEGYQSPDLIGKSLVKVKEGVRVNGGKEIRLANDGAAVDDDIPHAEPYPLVGLKEDAIEVPENERKGQALEVNEATFIYDRTDSVNDACRNMGYGVNRKVEQSIGKMILGLTNPYSRLGPDGTYVTSNTYLTTDGSAPHDFTNAHQNVLTDKTDINNALILLGGNTDPATGYEIVIREDRAKLLVMPQLRMTAQEITRAVTVEQRTASSAEIRVGPNGFAGYEVVVASFIWHNLLIAAGVSAANADGRWHFGDFMSAFCWRSIIPFEVFDTPPSAEQVRRDVLLNKVAREWGVAYVIEPRYVSKNTVEA